ncbi:PREDICTED: natriuretic peptides B [Hipposideros armiger]|uniref:Natriuretic peptides B n=1 Tax=Hipposideros armiger TaxID=186990 RepID=A0A8B7R3L9_HIPAR|nr:PREDICTED: natriuretic peptides B [Hipposideros armiger]
MDPQMAQPRALLLLLLLHLSLRGGRCHPLGGPGPALEPSKAQDKVSELQEGQVAPEPLQQDSGSGKAWEAKRAGRDVGPGPGDPQALQRPQVTTMKPVLDSCFGRKIDRINFHSRLGCNVVS